MKRALGIAAVVTVLAALAPASAGAVGFGIKGVESSLLGTGGEPLLTAGAHADFTAAVHLNTTVDPDYPPEGLEPADNAKDVEVMLPRGLIANPTGTETCSQEAFANLGTGTFCDPASQVGIATTIFYEQGIPLEFPTALYNLEPPVGLAAQFGFSVAGTDIYLNGGVTGRGGYRLQAVSNNVPETLAFADTSVTIWGLPFSPSHDFERSPLTPFGNQQPQPEQPPVPSEGPEVPLVSNPTACSGESLRTDARADSWQNPGVFVEGGTATDPQGRPLVIDGCEGLPFEASVEVQPTTEAAESPSGLDVDLKLPQSKLLGQRPASTLREAVITLPEGMAINPSSAGGLASCTPAQIGLGNDAQPTCPDAAKIGSAEIETPLLNHPLPGSVYLAQQGTNKFGSLLALYLVVDDPATGVLIKIPGKVETDPVSGRLVASFPNAPQLPFEELEVNLFPGSRAPLLTPPACGTYSTRGEFVPWSGTATVVSSDSFKVTTGPNGSACPTGAFDPTLRAASADAAAGQFSPFEIQLGREDGTQRFSGVSVALPKGLLARLAGVPYCPDAALAAIPTAEGTGAAQVASPSCPAASRVGSLSVAAGAGPSPFWDKQGSVYLAGPYKGAPLSLAFVVPALAGPFDLGNVAERVALDVNPVTTQVTAISDPLPTILAGIPLDLRSIWIQIDRPKFTVNPTSCAERTVEASLTSTGGASAGLTQPYRAASCAGLGFSPTLALKLKGPTKRNGFPALTANLTTEPGQANFARVTVGLPHSEFLEQGHIGTICTRVQFAARQCPTASIYGYAVAKTPLLGKPIKGPVYLRSSSHELPDLVAALRGQVEIDLDGRIESHKGGIQVTFEGLPDAPISTFHLHMKGGKKGLLVNSTQLCGANARATVAMKGQNGRHLAAKPPLQAPCAH